MMTDVVNGRPGRPVWEYVAWFVIALLTVSIVIEVVMVIKMHTQLAGMDERIAELRAQLVATCAQFDPLEADLPASCVPR